MIPQSCHIPFDVFRQKHVTYYPSLVAIQKIFWLLIYHRFRYFSGKSLHISGALDFALFGSSLSYLSKKQYFLLW